MASKGSRVPSREELINVDMTGEPKELAIVVYALRGFREF